MMGYKLPYCNRGLFQDHVNVDPPSGQACQVHDDCHYWGYPSSNIKQNIHYQNTLQNDTY